MLTAPIGNVFCSNRVEKIYFGIFRKGKARSWRWGPVPGLLKNYRFFSHKINENRGTSPAKHLN